MKELSKENVSLVFVDKPSRHFNNRTITPKYIVLHCIGYSDPLKNMDEQGVSCHYLIPQQKNNTNVRTVYEVVKPHLRAWHAGISRWKKDEGLNDCALGIEIHMPNYAKALTNQTLDFLYFEKYQPEQKEALILLVQQLQKKFSIPPQNVIGHSDIAPWRNISGSIEMSKTDPGPTLSWEELAKYGIGVWPKENNCTSFNLTASNAQELLLQAGYVVPKTGKFDRQTNLTLGASRLHFFNSNCFNESSGLAHSCYQKPFDQELACQLYKVGKQNSNHSFKPSAGVLIGIIAAGGVGSILVVLTFFYVLWYRYASINKQPLKEGYEEILEKKSLNK